LNCRGSALPERDIPVRPHLREPVGNAVEFGLQQLHPVAHRTPINLFIGGQAINLTARSDEGKTI
jgi:hypothetical protein